MSPSAPVPEPEPPGKTRTWWHPLLASVLRWQLANHYRVEEEVNVGKKPLQIDVLLLRQQAGDLPEGARRLLAGLAEHLNEYTLLELKSPSDTLRAGDFQTFLAYALLYRAQNQPLLPPQQLSLVVIAPRLTQPYREELRVCGVTAAAVEPGVWRLQGALAVQAIWLLETDMLADRDHPLLAVFSSRLLHDAEAVSRQLRQDGYDQLVAYVTRQIQQLHLEGEKFAMQHLGTKDEMSKVWREIVQAMTPEERLVGLSPEERLVGLSPEERLVGLSPEQREELLALLQQAHQPKKKPKRGKKA